jgi:hypothetical protein
VDAAGLAVEIAGKWGSKSVFQALFMEFGHLTVGKKIISINDIKE